MKFHQFSEIFPLIEGAEFDALVADIKEHGLREKIWIYEGKILDGRNRFLACQKAKVRAERRNYTGKDALSFVLSANMHRRHLTENQRALIAARIATMRSGARTDLASTEARSQSDAAKGLKVSRSAVQRATQVIERGSKALQQAVESDEISLSKAASVVDLPKSQQLKAATQKAPESDEPERPEWEPDEDARLEAAVREVRQSEDKVLRSNDVTAGYHDELKRQAAEIAVLKLARDGFMNGKQAMTKLLKAEQRRTEKQTRRIAELEKENAKLLEQIEALRERVSIMEAA